MWLAFTQIFCFYVSLSYGDIVWQQPEQVHIAYGSNIFEIVVTWSTFNETPNSIVEYGIGGLILQEKGTSKLFVDGGDLHRSQYIHKVTLKNLSPNSKYGKVFLYTISFFIKVCMCFVKFTTAEVKWVGPTYFSLTLLLTRPIGSLI